MIAWIIGLAVVSLALLAWQLGWFTPAGGHHDTGEYTGREADAYASGAAVRPRPSGNTDTEAKSESQDDSKSQGASRNGGVVGAAVHTGCTPSASSEKNIMANQCRGRGARYDLFDDMGTKRNLTSDPQKQGILASNVAPRAKHADEQLYDYDKLHARLHGQPRQAVERLYYGNNGVTPQKVAAALQNELTAIDPAAAQFAGIGY